jgi:hypothetical protein
MFDEPSSYLDVKQRLKAAGAIRDLLNEDRYVMDGWMGNRWINGWIGIWVYWMGK